MSHHPRKRFGQNFLRDPEVIQRIVMAIGPHPADALVEIGPGLGAITLPLLTAAGRLSAIELDRDLILPLQQRCRGKGELTVYNDDSLQFDFCALYTDKPLRIVGNLPYNISTPLLFHLLDQHTCIGEMFFMLQKEVVERMSAVPGTGSYGRLSVMLQYRCAVTPLFQIGPESFDPPPRVESAFVQLVPHAAPPVAISNEVVFADLVRHAFAQRRKTLRNTLRGMLEAEAIAATGIDPTRRAETLSLEEFAALANRVVTPG